MLLTKIMKIYKLKGSRRKYGRNFIKVKIVCVRKQEQLIINKIIRQITN